jgi:hypothetical protein
MIQKKTLRRASSLSLVFMLVCVTVGASCAAAQLSPTTLEITAVKGGFSKISVTVKNIGNVTANNITMIMSVTGGILNRINITKICTGCGNCSNSIEPNATKTESTLEAGRIIGFGPVTISASAQAINADKVEKILNGFVLGPFVIVTK